MRPTSGLPLFKRVVAIVVLLCFGSFTLEALIADVHDGDVSALEVASTSVASSNSASQNGDHPLRAPTHERHACHCVHAHACSVSQTAALPNVPETRTLLISQVVREPGQVVLLQQFRPPIATMMRAEPFSRRDYRA